MSTINFNTVFEWVLNGSENSVELSQRLFDGLDPKGDGCVSKAEFSGLLAYGRSTLPTNKLDALVKVGHYYV